MKKIEMAIPLWESNALAFAMASPQQLMRLPNLLEFAALNGLEYSDRKKLQSEIAQSLRDRETNADAELILLVTLENTTKAWPVGR